MTDKPYTDADVELVRDAMRDAPMPPRRNGYIDGRDVEIAESRAALDALSAASRLLPAGDETHTEHEIDWTARYGRAGTETITYWDLDDAQLAKETEAALLFDSQMLRHRQRTHRKWPDGSTLVGPWISEVYLGDRTEREG